MLYPVRNKFRSFIDLSGFWKFKADREDKGESKNWHKGFESDTEIAVPGSWNEQLEELGMLHYTGTAWYSLKLFVPAEFSDKRIVLRFGSVDYNSRIWLDGKLLGENSQGFLPFEFDVTDRVRPGEESLLILKVNNELGDETIPQGVKSEYFAAESRLREETYPAARFDFSPFGGIHRPVILYATPRKFITDIKIDTRLLNGHRGSVSVRCRCEGSAFENEVEMEAGDEKQVVRHNAELNLNKAAGELIIDDCIYWSPECPHLYDLKVSLKENGRTIDEYVLQTGVREIKISGTDFLINGKKTFFKGFGKHEDFYLIGKGLFLPQIIKDFELMKWAGANSFRTSHYPYSEELMSYADRKGFLVIDEVPAISLDFRHVNENTLSNHKKCISRLIDRDYNHPCVVMWTPGNEPNLVGEESYYDGRGERYWKEVTDHCRSLDNTRPVSIPNCTRAGLHDPVFKFSDVISINRYYGWYEHPGDLDFALNRISSEMDELYRLYKKPVFMTEFGADTVPGAHSTSMQMFTEEYQSEILKRYIEVIESKDYSIGEHVWNLADFRTPQHFRRVILNLKGVFTRTREPKLAAFMLRDLWNKE